MKEGDLILVSAEATGLGKPMEAIIDKIETFMGQTPVPVYGCSRSSSSSFSSFLKSCGEDFLINRTCFTASLENSISYIAFALYTVKKIVQRLILGHSEGISVSDIFNTSLDSRKFFL